ncbi:hypothetical protein vBBceSLY5_0004 [Bacillus phage vB_BceS_LY5]|uniref:hypothetical protein n=1 Tax=Bacillus phage vB_BceS_LY5 TaxID=2996058 RepID=UPI0040550B60|nr:hypothetical protein vBBceSLY5_0004 [Bacillus phage vB_BceS_LY5]
MQGTTSTSVTLKQWGGKDMHEKWTVATNAGMYVERVKLEQANDPEVKINLTNVIGLAMKFNTKAAALDIAIRIGGVIERA